MHVDEFLRARKWATIESTAAGKDRWRPLQKRARQSMNRPTIIELSSEANANARRMWNKLTTGGPLNEIHPSLVMKKKEREKTNIAACVHRYSNFLRASRFPVISTKHRNVGNYSHAYESSIRTLRGRTVCIWIPWIPKSYSENSEELCWLCYIGPWLNVQVN